MEILQHIIDLIRLKKLPNFIKSNPFVLKTLLNIFSICHKKGVSRIKNKILRASGVKIGKNVRVANDITISYPHNLELEDYTNLGPNTVLSCWHKVHIGKYTFMSTNNVFVAGGHMTDDFSNLSENQEIHIGKGCWIGANCTFLGGGAIGNGSIVAAGSVVIGREYPPFSIIAGVPARVIKKRKYAQNIIAPTEYNVEEIMSED